MKLVLLGTGGYHPNARRQTACLLLPEAGVMLDAGTATSRVAERLVTSELNVFLTHAHLDHVVGLTFLFNVLRAHPLERVTVHARPEKLTALDEHLFATALFPKKPPFASRPLESEVLLNGGGRVRWFPLVHQGGAVGFRLDWRGCSMAYVTDTTADPQAEYVAAIDGVDLLVHECYYGDEDAAWARTTGHSSTSEVARVAQAARVGRLVLVHFDPLRPDDDPVGLATARTIFPATELGEDEMEIEF